MKARQSLGKKGESIAIDYLRRQGYTILGKNFRFDRAEIDVIAKDKDILVFVEVKTRRSGSLGDPEDAVTMRKRSQLIKAAQGYLYQSSLSDVECRFDVISIKESNGKTVISHYKDAFGI